ncbi:sulfurtransferase [Maribacter algarum]|uniref:Sulfurtransferase n=1 Tax=Maribacter algarum (ex Zhang et al. 2020) TaxID=2578118 RepID=A0A5S3PWU9_9FLAO|nr:sulfurtransferase [Maribacter algarum]TMM57478.1 sulfurtransferase [Maribacter algarum]
MNWRISEILLIFLALFSCRESVETKALVTSEEASNYYSIEHLIDVKELKRAQNEDALKIIDFRKPEEYKAGHIPNALNIWRSDIEDTSYPYKGMAASKIVMEKLLSSMGIQPNDIIIIYDDKGLCDAARLWWVLKTYNFNTVKLLNGGWTDWKKNQGLISNNLPKITPSNFTFSDALSNDYLIQKDSLQAQLDNENIVLIDARTADEFSGKRLKAGAKRGGRIPNSFNIDWTEAINSSNRKFKSPEAIEKVYAQIGVTKDKPIVVYCHTGVRSAHTTFVLTELLGYANVKNYDGSWSEWSYYDELPIEKDSVTIVLK